MSEITPEAILYTRFVLRADVYPKHCANGAYVPVHQPLSLDVLRDHVAGRHCVGVYQLRDTKVKWICLDIDGTNDNADNARDATLALARTCSHFGLTPYVERSGGKGWHVWVFTEVIEASLAQVIGRGLIAEMDEDARCGTSEIVCFPKQVDASNAFGNLVKLPWGKRADNGKRGVFVDPGTLAKLSQDEQLALLSAITPHSAAELEELAELNGWKDDARTPRPASSSGLISRGAVFHKDLPCYEALVDIDCEAKIPSGARNNVLFAFASQRKRAGSSERVALRDIINLNRDRCSPPLDEREVRTLVTSCFKSVDSSACCDIVQNAGLCPAREGVICPIYQRAEEKREKKREAFNAEEDKLTLQPLEVMRTEPPIYTATVKGRRIQLSLKELYNFRLFKERCIASLDFVPELPFIPRDDDPKKPLPPTATWERIVNEALQALIEAPAPPEDASPRGAVWSEIKAFLTDGALGERREDVKKGLVVVDAIAGVDCYLFRGEDLRRRLKLLRADELPISEVWKIIHDHGGKSGSVDTADGDIRMWRIPVDSVRERPSTPPPAISDMPPLGLLQ